MKELLEKYSNSTISATEREAIKQYFLTHRQELEAYFCEQEWNGEKYDLLKNNLLSSGRMDEWFEQQEHKKKRNKSITYAALAACACTAILFGIGRFFYTTEKTDVLSKNAAVVYENNGTSVKSIILPDSSLVDLSPRTKIVLDADYNQQQRNIELSGTAVFHVHKDTSRRFTVFSGNVATTAVGTVFKVNNSGTKKISVQLIEGKILVKEKNNNTQSYYLLPGKTIAYESATRHFEILDDAASSGMRNNIARRRNAPDLDIAIIKPGAQNIQINTVPNGISFKNDETVFTDTRLPDVFETLATQYKVKIAYPAGKAAAIRFAGNIDKNQSIQKILSDIAIMNNFRLEADTANQSFRLY